MESDESNGDVDEALLEGLFYNEMLFLEDPPLPAEENYELPVTTPDRAAAALTSPEVAPFPSVPQEASVVVNGGFSSASTCSVPAMMQHPWSDPSAGAASAAAPPAVPIEVQEAPPVSRVSQERAQQLVSQFATLAERLGISLPESVLQSLTDSAARNEAQTTVVTTTDAASLPQTVPSSTATAPESTIAASLPAASLPKKHSQLEIMAEAAIAAVSEPRKREAPPTKQPLYSKRRKKAQLSDCEAKLAALKQENEMLKRHLATVTNKAQVFDQERAQATFQMKRMLDEGASPEKLDPVLHKFSEMYSDYGRHRHDELTFHLSQLEKLAAPTTFTKMGLWTLGQNEGFYTNPKRNPIAGILRKELGITPVQGRKILDQRQQIRDVCDNLKQCLELLGKLKSICEHKQKVFHDRMSKCQEILTPLQVVKLLLWVDGHSHLLESVCPGWGSERIRPKEDSKKPGAT